MPQDPTDDIPDADAMKAQLRKDVASWAAARAGAAGETPDMATRAAPKPQPARVAKQKPTPPPVTVTAPTEGKPFRMSYDGTSVRDYIAHRVKLGAR